MLSWLHWVFTSPLPSNHIFLSPVTLQEKFYCSHRNVSRAASLSNLYGTHWRRKHYPQRSSECWCRAPAPESSLLCRRCLSEGHPPKISGNISHQKINRHVTSDYYKVSKSDWHWTKVIIKGGDGLSRNLICYSFCQAFKIKENCHLCLV